MSAPAPATTTPAAASLPSPTAAAAPFEIPIGPDGRPVKMDTKTMSKAQRRAYQEAMRAAKSTPAPASSSTAPAAATASSAAPSQQHQQQHQKASDAGSTNTTTNATTAATTRPTTAASSGSRTRPSGSAAAATNTGHSSIQSPMAGSKTMALFGHLPPPTPPTAAASSSSSSSSRGTQAVGPLHPAVLGIGHRMASGLLVGANARARAMLDAFAAVVRDYATPPDAMLSRHLAQVLGAHISYLSDVRPLTPGMGAAIRGLKHVVSSVAPDMPDPDAKELIIEYIDTFIHERITMAVASLSQLAMPKIKSGDVILTYGYSSSVASILRAVAASGLSFRAIVVDDPAAAAGAVGGVRMARDVLVPAGVPVTYVQLTGAGSAVRDASMVLLGATGMLAHGGLLARAGTAAVAMLARARNVPVVVACETYKFSHAIHLDSIVFNELAPITPLGGATGGEESSAVKRLALVYDVTPPEFLTVVITELGLMPVTSVPVVLREYKPLLESGGPLAVSS